MTDKKNLVLIDTSIWVDYFRGKEKTVCLWVDELLETDRVVTAELIEAELYRGARSERELHFLAEYFSKLPCLETPPNFWKMIGKFCHKLARQGCVTGLADAFIAMMAIQHGVLLCSRDHDFKRIAALSELKLYYGHL